MPSSSFRLGLLRRFILRRACSMPSTQTFLTEEQVMWSSSTATTLQSSSFIRKKDQTPHLSSLSSSSLNFKLILLRIRAHQTCIYQQSLPTFPMTKRDGLKRRTRRSLWRTKHPASEQCLLLSSAQHFCCHQ